MWSRPKNVEQQLNYKVAWKRKLTKVKVYVIIEQLACTLHATSLMDCYSDIYQSACFIRIHEDNEVTLEIEHTKIKLRPVSLRVITPFGSSYSFRLP